MSLTSRRKLHFSHYVLSGIESKIGFADVGSGGELKSPWDLLPFEKIHKFDFDPEELRDQELPICLSNQVGDRVFYIADDLRASSLHQASKSFVERFNRPLLYAKDRIQVRCTTLDHYFAGRFDEVDLLDVNTEGHDYQVLQGAIQLLTEGFIKCIKVEFELTEVWQGQGWFSDIDAFLRSKRYDLAYIDVEFARPASVQAIFHRGEPLWGKAIYVPSFQYWRQRQQSVEPLTYKEDVLKSIVLYTILDMPGRSVDLLAEIGAEINVSPLSVTEIISRISDVFKFALIDTLWFRLTGLLHRFRS